MKRDRKSSDMLYTMLITLSMVSTIVVSHSDSFNPFVMLQLLNPSNSIKSYVFAQHFNL